MLLNPEQDDIALVRGLFQFALRIFLRELKPLRFEMVKEIVKFAELLLGRIARSNAFKAAIQRLEAVTCARSVQSFANRDQAVCRVYWAPRIGLAPNPRWGL